ncbi:hypothetical protein [Actinomyces vulturis]|uniref:hypothetical protein n=1 Tax=Actinomyces vulturis TaxID=1857645 RepID=UPI000831B6C2|nr:hypothetical protein [Actinomyces vulturis]
MCRAVTCRQCKKTTWAGCGRHVDAVMKNVPRDQRCTCSTDASQSDNSQSSGGFFARLFGR